MPIIKPVSDLRNYNEVLREVKPGVPVFLTKNGRGKYAIYEIDEVERSGSEARLILELARGEKSAQEQGWLSEADIESRLNEAI